MYDTISYEEIKKLKISFLHFCDSSRNKLDNDGQNFTFLNKDIQLLVDDW